MQVARVHVFERLAQLIGHPEWVTEERFATPYGWVQHLEEVIRPAIEKWAAGRNRLEVCAALSEAGIAAGPCARAEELVADAHVTARQMLVGIERRDGVDQPVLVPGNPVRIVDRGDGRDRRIPWLGEHTDEVLHEELGLSDAAIERLRSSAVVG
jgi:crotonobetainyl-CoA:carnitine CoA-transferase CaiB-like acyl-CoA transferase